MKFATMTVPLCGLAVFLSGTEARAQDHHAEATSGEPLVIMVEMADRSFSPEALRIPAGQPVMLVFENTGSVEHEFMAGRHVMNGDFEVDLFTGLDVEVAKVPAGGADTDAGHEHAEAAEDHDHADVEDHADAEDHDHADAGDGHGTMVLL